MASKAFAETVSNLSSDKLKDRAQGLDDVRFFLSVPRNLEWLNEDRKQWLKFLQAVFQIVVDEQKSYIKKPTGPALKRLKDSAQAVRLVVEKATPDIPRKAFKAVFNHILSICVVRGQLFEPIALEYLRALRAVISYRPHLDHLETTQWTHAVSVCFAAILGDNIRGYDLVDDYLMETDEDEGNADSGSTGSKRKAKVQLRASVADHRSAESASRPSSRAVSQDVIELWACLEALLQPSNAPLVNCAEALLGKCIRFLHLYPSESSAHLSALVSLNRLLTELEFNEGRLLDKAASRLWPEILNLWSTKNVAVKEQLVMSTTTLLPFMDRQLQQDVTHQLKDLVTVIYAEADARWGCSALELDCLSFTCDTVNGPARNSTFRTSILTAGKTFDKAQALSWAITSLASAALTRLRTWASRNHANGSTPSRPAKKSKTESLDLFAVLLDSLRTGLPKVVVHHLQIVLFYLEQETPAIAVSFQEGLLGTVDHLLANEDSGVQSWTLVLLSAIARRATMWSREYWTSIWAKALKKFYQPHSARAACFLLAVLSHSSLIEPTRMSADLLEIGSSMETQGPPSPSDAACFLFDTILSKTAGDMKSYKASIPERLCNRIINNWRLFGRITSAQRSFGQKSQIETLPVHDIFCICLSIAGLPTSSLQLSFAETSIPDCEIARYWNDRINSNAMREWYWHATLPALCRRVSKNSAPEPPSRPFSNSMSVRLLGYLHRYLSDAVQELDDADEVYWSGISVPKLGRMLDVAVLALLLDAAASHGKVVRVEHVYPLSLKVIEHTLPRLRRTKWTMHERAFLLQSLEPLFLSAAVRPNLADEDVLISASRTSGIPRDRLREVSTEVPRSDTSNSATFPHLLQELWAAEGLIEKGLSGVMEVYDATFRDMLCIEPIGEQTEKAVDFGIRTADSTSSISREMYDANSTVATATCISISLRALVTIAYFRQPSGSPVRLRQVCKAMLDGGGSHLILVGMHLLAAVPGGHLTLGTSEVDGLVEKLGSELLPSYEYSRSEGMQQLLLELLQVTGQQWGRTSQIALPYVDHIRRLAAWLAGQLLASNVASWRTRLRCAKLFQLFVSDDSLELSAFGHESEPSACSKGVPIPPETLLVRMLGDPDYRIRFAVAAALGHACGRVHREGRQSYTFWEDILQAQAFEFNEDGFDANTPLLLAYGNVMIASDYFRSHAYGPVTILAAMNKSRNTSKFIRSTLSATSERLGLNDLADLYTFLAPYTLAEQILAGREGLVIPDPSAFGFSTHQALAVARFEETAPMALASERPHFFEDLCRSAGMSELDMKATIFPVYTAYKLTASVPGGQQWKLAEEAVALTAFQVAQCLGSTGPDLLSGVRDLVVWRILSFVFEAEYSLERLESIFLEVWPDHSAIKELHILFSDHKPRFEPNVLSPPDVALRDTLSILKGGHPAVAGALENESIVFKIMSNLLCSVASPPFLSQQLRLLYNTFIGIACASPTIVKSPGILCLIIHHTVRLMASPDLVAPSGAIFLWAVRKLIDTDISGLVAPFKEILRAAQCLLPMTQDEDRGVRRSSSQTLQTLEQILPRLLSHSNPAVRDAMQQLQALWVRPLQDFNHMSVHTMHKILLDNRGEISISHALPPLAEALRASALTANETRTLSATLWTFLRNMHEARFEAGPPSAELAAFAEILWTAQGRIEPPDIRGISQRLQQRSAPSASVKRALIDQMTTIFDGTDLTAIGTAIDALQCMLRDPDVMQDIANAALPLQVELLASGKVERLTRKVGLHLDSLESLANSTPWMQRGSNRTEWQREFALLLSNTLGLGDPFYEHLSRVLVGNSDLSRLCLPSLVRAILLNSETDDKVAERTHLSLYFFKLLQAEAPCGADIVDIVLALREFEPAQSQIVRPDPLGRDHWLSVPWHELVKAAIVNEAHHAALLFLEINSSAPDAANPKLEDYFYQVYSHVDDPDGFYSIRPANLQAGLLHRLHHEKRWFDALSWHGSHMESANSAAKSRWATGGVLESLARNDLGQLSMTLLKGTDGFSMLSSSTLSQLAWKTSSWDLPILQRDATGTGDWQLFHVLKASQQLSNDTGNLSLLVNKAYDAEMKMLARVDINRPVIDSEHTKTILALREVAKRTEDPAGFVANCMNAVASGLPEAPYELRATLLNARIILLRGIHEAEARETITDEVTDLASKAITAERHTLMCLSDLAQTHKNAQVALNAVSRWSSLVERQDQDFELEMAIASVLWLKGESAYAIDSLRALCELKLDLLEPIQHARALATMGKWIATARLEDAMTIRHKYFKPSWDLISRLPLEDADSFKASIAAEFARFADEQYQQTTTQVAEIEQLDSYTRRKEVEVRQLAQQTTKASQSIASELASRKRVAYAIYLQDRQAVTDFKESRRSLLSSAILMYGESLAASSQADDCVFRFCSLWLENAEEKSVCRLAADILAKISAHHFVSLVPQLSARLASQNMRDTADDGASISREALFNLVERLAQDHPYHSLFQIYFLYRSAMSGQGSQSTQKRRVSLPTNGRNHPGGTIGLLTDRLRSLGSLQKTALAVEKATDAYIEWASYPVEKPKASGKKARPVPADLKLLKLKSLALPVTTITVPIEQNCKYSLDQIPLIQGYKPMFTTAGGVNLPKITECIGSDGRLYKQLFKGGDDVRQDAVMQQVFAVTNDLLSHDASTRSRSLGIRTYKVVPLTNDCGLLEFVRDSQAIGEWLIPAHDRYHPDDMSISEARKTMGERMKSGPTERIQAFETVLPRVRPVMRHFFTERHHVPYWWFQMRLIYSRSAAVMSMIGWVLGIGDRHVSNIMIDTANGELVPIDFGIAFEAGKQLPTPEHVPFRLTQDIIDGFGMSGVEGVFRKCSEETIKVLRTKAAVLMTILEVFKYDPLQKWTAAAAKIRRVQGSQAADREPESSREEELTDADRAIRTVSEKLKTGLSVEYTVNNLIQQATDVKNLGAIYFGWQPYL